MAGWYDAELIARNRAASRDVKGTRPIDNALDAIALYLIQAEFCSNTTCEKCPMYMYGESCSVEKASSYFKDKLKHPRNDPKKWNEWYEKLAEVIEGAKAPQNTCGKCNSCTQYEENFAGGGIPFCKAWHNFTVGGGYCYLYQMKITENPVENSAK